MIRETAVAGVTLPAFQALGVTILVAQLEARAALEMAEPACARITVVAIRRGDTVQREAAEDIADQLMTASMAREADIQRARIAIGAVEIVDAVAIRIGVGLENTLVSERPLRIARRNSAEVAVVRAFERLADTVALVITVGCLGAGLLARFAGRRVESAHSGISADRIEATGIIEITVAIVVAVDAVGRGLIEAPHLLVARRRGTGRAVVAHKIIEAGITAGRLEDDVAQPVIAADGM